MLAPDERLESNYHSWIHSRPVSHEIKGCYSGLCKWCPGVANLTIGPWRYPFFCTHDEVCFHIGFGVQEHMTKGGQVLVLKQDQQLRARLSLGLLAYIKVLNQASTDRFKKPRVQALVCFLFTRHRIYLFLQRSWLLREREVWGNRASGTHNSFHDKWRILVGYRYGPK